MGLKNLNPKVKFWLIIACSVLLVFLSVFAGGILACSSGGGRLMEDFSCVDTSRLDLCRTSDGLVWQLPDDNPVLVLNLSDGEVAD
jgi:hypothetical protein